MKINKFLLAGIATIAIVACSNDKETDDVIDPSNVNTYMTLQLVGPQGNLTKTTPGEDETEVGTDVENTISGVTVLLCDPDAHTVSHVYTIKEGLIPINNGVKTKPFAVTTGIFDVYVIANDPAASVITENEDVTGKTITSITEALMQTQYAADNKFIMFNECNGNEDAEIKGTSITIEEGNDYNRPATCDVIKLDRLAVQIRSAATEEGVNIDDVTTEFEAITAVALKGFRLLNGATEVNLQQHWTAATTAQGSNAPWLNTLITPTLEAGSWQGTPTPEYYNHLSDFRTIEKTIAGDNSEDYTAAKDNYTDIAAYNEEAGNIYCMENNPTYANGYVEAKNGNTTGLIYQWQATVEGSDELAGENCFYAYDGEFYASLENLAKAHPNVFDEAEGEDASDKLEAAKNELENAEDEDGISAFRTKYLIKVYKDGIMYYTYFIKDKNYKQVNAASGEEDQPNAANYYSVMRNTIYDLTVTKLLRVGTDIPGGWNPDVDPDDPVDNKNVYMVVSVTVNPWVLSKENIELK